MSAIRVNVRSSFDENLYGFNSVIRYRMAEHSLSVAPRIGVRARVDENSYYFGPIVKYGHIERSPAQITTLRIEV